jgi:Predicted membrane protein
MVITLFAGGSVLGWFIELFFRRYLDPVERLKKRFTNPGFLAGPCLPIYGTGLVALYALAHIRIPALEASHPIVHKLVVFLLMALAMTLVEFITGMIFIVHMHLELWDYTPYWGNIKGVICPLFSCFWYALAAFYYMIMHPRIESILSWMFENLGFLFFVGFFYGVFVVDVIYSFNVVVRIKKLAEEYGIVVKYRALKGKIQDMADEAKDRSVSFIFSKLTANSLRSMFANYRDNFSVKRRVIAKYNEYKIRKGVITDEDDAIMLDDNNDD